MQPAQMAAMAAPGQTVHVQPSQAIHVAAAPSGAYYLPYNASVPTAVMEVGGAQPAYIDHTHFSYLQTSTGTAAYVQAQQLPQNAMPVAVPSGPPVTIATVVPAATTVSGTRTVAIPTATVTPTIPATATGAVKTGCEILANEKSAPSVEKAVSEVHSGLTQRDVQAQERVSSMSWAFCSTTFVGRNLQGHG